jgi:pyruvate dehydrogenase E2 component (dihydrolipoamide acetyltransferase)
MADFVQLIQLSPTMEEGLIVSWTKKPGDKISTGDILAEVETDKATMEMESYFDGILLEIFVPAGSTAKVGTALAVIGKAGESYTIPGAAAAKAAPAPAAAPTPTAPAAAAAPSAPAPAATGRLLSSPLARKVAQEAGVAIETLQGSGPAGRIIRRDVEAAASAPVAAPPAAPTAAPRAATPAPAPRSTQPGAIRTAPEGRVEPLSQMRKAISRNLTAAWTAPAFTLTREIAMEATLAARQQVNDALVGQKVDTKVSVNDFVVAAAARALRDLPEMNAAYVEETLHLYDSVDIGIAVAIEGGLITPVIRDADRKGLRALAEEAKALAERGRNKKLAPHEFTGATFSISNLGMFGIDHFTAVLAPPAAGILAVGRTRAIPVVDAKQNLVVGQRMNVTITCDHRAVDGAVGARFLQRFAAYLESPALLLL